MKCGDVFHLKAASTIQVHPYIDLAKNLKPVFYIILAYLLLLSFDGYFIFIRRFFFHRKTNSKRLNRFRIKRTILHAFLRSSVEVIGCYFFHIEGVGENEMLVLKTTFRYANLTSRKNVIREERLGSILLFFFRE